MTEEERQELLIVISKRLSIGDITNKEAKALRRIAWSDRTKRTDSDWPLEAIGEGVYVIKEDGTNYVKIGGTADFLRRYGKTRKITDNPRPMVFLGWLDRDPTKEHFYQNKYKRFSVIEMGGGTEWFLFSDEDLLQLKQNLIWS